MANLSPFGPHEIETPSLVCIGQSNTVSAVITSFPEKTIEHHLEYTLAKSGLRARHFISQIGISDDLARGQE